MENYPQEYTCEPGGMKEPEGATYEYEVTSKWNDYSADDVYTVTRFSVYPNGERKITNAWGGDAAWAERMAKHYNIETPAKENE